MHTRREFIAGTVAVGGFVLLTKYQNAAASVEPQLVLYDPEAAGARPHACATLPVVGDRVRFARDVFGAPAAPAMVAGVTTYADYILLSGCAAEHGYRVLSEPLPAAGERALVEWKVRRVCRATCSG
jgi:hypothetical protein